MRRGERDRSRHKGGEVIMSLRKGGHQCTGHIILDLNGTLVDTKRAFLATRARLITSLANMVGSDRESLCAEVRVFLANNSLHPDIAGNLPLVIRWLDSVDTAAVRDERSLLLAREIA